MISLTSLTASSSFDAIAAAQFEAERQAPVPPQTVRPPRRRRTGGVLLGLALVVVAALGAASAKAAPVSRTYTVSAPTSGPLSSFTLVFDITFDNGADITSDTTAGLSIVSAPSSWNGSIGYQYWAGSDVLAIGGTNGGVLGFSLVEDDLYFTLRGASAANPVVPAFQYTDQGEMWTNGSAPVSVSFTVDDPASPAQVPEPATLALVGAAGLGLVTTGRRRSGAAA